MTMFRLRDTHAYPGCVCTIQDLDTGGAAHAEFSDGVVVPAQYSRDADELRLCIDAYTTARGAHVDAKAWWLRSFPEEQVWKIVRRDQPE